MTITGIAQNDYQCMEFLTKQVLILKKAPYVYTTFLFFSVQVLFMSFALFRVFTLAAKVEQVAGDRKKTNNLKIKLLWQ